MGIIVTPAEMRAAEEAIFARGVEAEELMEKAGRGIADLLRERFPGPGRAVAYLGKGHNAGDALVVGRHLREWGWEVSLREAGAAEDVSPLTRQQRERFLATPESRVGGGPLVLLDGLLGIGARGPLRGIYADLAREMNARREEGRAWVVAMDVPSGVDAETGVPGEDAVRADYTFTVGYVKTGLVADVALGHVGILASVPLPEIELPPGGGDPGARVLTVEELRRQYRRRPVDHFKNRAGRVAVLAGSVGFTGAAAMTAEGALAAGAGLVSLHVPKAIYPILAARCPPEIMVHALPESLSVEWLKALDADVFAVGPGWGSEPAPEFLAWLREEPRSVVVDADGLNLLARHPDARRSVAEAGPRLLTPHPGEFRRLFPEESQLPTRRQQAEAVVERYPWTLLLKGARTLIAHRGESLAINLTGNPGMATGGMGDVLTGVCASLVGQGYGLSESGCFGAWLCGRAADVALRDGETVETLRATHLLPRLAPAFREIDPL